MSRRRPLIAVAGLACETSTFTPSRTQAAAFQPRRGDEVIDKYPFIQPGSPLGDAADWRGALIGHALPGGAVTRDAFETLAAEIIARLKEIMASSSSSGIDGLWFDIHGAMCVEGEEDGGIDDAESELLRRCREVVGPQVLVSASMDLHGNVSAELAHQTDLITCYRTAPHVDVAETKERACRNLVELLGRRDRGEQPVRPLKAWIPLPVLLPGEQTSTRDEPAAVRAGVGATVTVTAGAEVDDIHAGPITMTGRVHAVKTGDRYARVEAVLQVGSVFAILTELRKPYHLERDFAELGLSPRGTAAIVVVKIGYLEPELYDMAADWMLGLTPGGVDQDLKRLGHRRICRPMWPFDRRVEGPQLSAR
ncbi:hypothetical protein F4778DRAFT_758076 [Xylariomycetidae sp. FL2044]|nr:hypothetical protein F4778DRAFT_758076 [Xylariomycetidae sp. FL2044]